MIIRCEWKKAVLDYVDENNVEPREVFETLTIDAPFTFDVEAIQYMVSQWNDAVFTEELL